MNSKSSSFSSASKLGACSRASATKKENYDKDTAVTSQTFRLKSSSINFTTADSQVYIQRKQHQNYHKMYIKSKSNPLDTSQTINLQ